ncbi:MAG: hypothetical protein ACYTG0_31030, partial [Planctomycetota bacterium]
METWIRSRDWIAEALNRGYVADPGQTFLYSMGNSHFLSGLLKETTGVSPGVFADLLGLTKEQRERIPEISMMWEAARGQTAGERLKQRKEQVLAILTEEQRKKLEELKGEPFDTTQLTAGSFSRRPGSFSRRPGSFSRRPGSFSRRPGSFSRRPGSFSRRPGGSLVRRHRRGGQFADARAALEPVLDQHGNAATTEAAKKLLTQIDAAEQQAEAANPLDRSAETWLLWGDVGKNQGPNHPDLRGRNDATDQHPCDRTSSCPRGR